MSCAAAMLLIPRARRVTLALVAGLLLLFAVAMASTLVRGIPIPCGCFRGADLGDSLGWTNVLRNLALATVALGAILLRQARVGKAGFLHLTKVRSPDLFS